METPSYKNLVDIHCHLLPNVDDGPTTWEESLEMARLAFQDGIRISVTTPHWIQGTRWEPNPDEIRGMVKELNEKLRENGIPLIVLPGMEVGISENLQELLSSQRILTLGGSSSILIEIPFISLPYGIEEIVFDLKAMGISPILAHPERNKEIQKNPDRVLELVRAGALLQVTAGSLCGYFGEQARRCAFQLARLGVVHAVASDAHNVEERPPIVTDGLRVLEGFIGVEGVNELTANTYGLIVRESEPLKVR
jgi:protein-tyrosine phosphatase